MLWRVLGDIGIGLWLLGPILFVVAVVAFWAINRVTTPAADSATHFVTTAGAAGPAAAYAEAAPALRATMPEPEFEAKLKQLRLTEAKSVSSSSTDIYGDVATVSVTATSASGDTTPLTILLLRSGGRWLVNDFLYRAASPPSD